VLEQNFSPSEFEILVVDDGLPTALPNLSRNSPRRVTHLPKKNGGQASAFNFGVPQCRGEIVAFLDGDDWWAANKLTRVVESLAADSSVGIVGHGIANVQRDGSTSGNSSRGLSI